MKLLEHIYILTWVHNTSPRMFSALRANILELLPTNILVYCQPLKKSALFTRVQRQGCTCMSLEVAVIEVETIKYTTTENYSFY